MTELLQSTFEQVNTIAEAWLASGASSFSLWTNGELSKQWGLDQSKLDESIHAPIRKNGYPFGELRVSGNCSQPAQTRLAADAKVLAALLQMEENQKQVCEELIDTRDQLVILSSIADLTRQVIDSEEMLSLLAAEAIKLVKSEEAFFILHLINREPLAVFYPRQSIDMEVITETSWKIQAAEQPFLLFADSVGANQGVEKNVLLIPMNVYDAPLAVMGLSWSKEKEIGSYEIKLSRAIADYAGAQIEKLNLMRSSIEMARMDTEINLAQKIQQSLLIKKMPRVPSLEICSSFQPASRVSGDYYDMILKPDQSLDFIIGDISGKGMPAALLMAMTLKVIRSVAVMPTNPTPDVIITRSNDILYKDYNDSVMFSTLFVGHYDQVAREVYYSNAGHSPIIYYQAGKKAEMLWADTVPIGLFQNINCQLARVKLGAGDILVLATDGINETSNKSSRLFGFTQLMTLVEKNASGSACEISAEILSAVQAYGAGKSQEDDRAMIVIKGV